MAILPPRQRLVAFRWITLLLGLGALATFVPLWAPLVLATWVAVMGRPLLLRFARWTGGRDRAAGALVVLLLLAVFLPIGGALVSLSHGAIELGRNMLKSGSAKNALISVVSGGDSGAAGGGGTLEMLKSPGKIVALLQEHGATAAQIVGGALGAATEALLGVFIFLYAVYVFLIDGPTYYKWLERHAPLDVAHTRRLASAFNETGRGLLVSVGLTGLAQGIVATITYFALGVPRALVLGLVTCIASLIPSVGTALVWIPVAVGLALAGKTVAALVMVGVGVIVIGMIDNVTRPMFARFGKLDLSNFVLLTSMFGGLGIFGAWGLLLGPLFARLAKEALVILKELASKTSDLGAAPGEPGEST